jgi:hypothetical protein
MARTRNSVKPEHQQDGKPVKLTLTLPADLAKRFGVHAEMLGISKSEFFAKLVRDGCKRFVVHDHGKDTGESAEAGAA